MKKIIICIFALLLSGVCIAEEAARQALEEADISRMRSFARQQGVEGEFSAALDGALSGNTPSLDSAGGWLKEKLREPLEEAARKGQGMLAPVLLLAMLRAAGQSRGGSEGACFLLRLMLLLGFSETAVMAFDAAEACLATVKEFSDAVSPALTAILAAMGMNGASALVSPAAAMAGNAAEGLFLNYGMPVCRIALCTALAGNLSPMIDLGRVTQMLKKAANWGAGLATTLFTALLALQGTVTESLDGVAVRTAKFAVDSAAPVIGSGVSDAWDSYISGMLIAKNAIGVSGIAAVLSVGLKPVFSCASAMFLLSALAALLDVLGEKETARAAEQIGGICQMALSLSTGALVIATVLLGAAMAAGGNLMG